MHSEFILLGATLVLALVYVMAAAQVRTRQYGLQWNMGPRDDAVPPPSPIAGRLARAQSNLFETLPLFIGALLGAAATGHLGWASLLGAHLFFWARLAYLPLYAWGVTGVRSLAWGVATFGVLVEIWALLFG